MRIRPLVLTGVALTLLGPAAGCAADRDPAPAMAALPAPTPTDWPAAIAGGACGLLDYAIIEDAIGVRFDVAANHRAGKTDTCVVQAGQKSRPDLSLTVSPTTVDAEFFADEVAPDGSSAVSGLGAAAYRSVTAPTKRAGAAVEVGWLSKSKRLMTLRFTAAPGGTEKAATALAPRLTALAKKVDKAKPPNLMGV